MRLPAGRLGRWLDGLNAARRAGWALPGDGGLDDERLDAHPFRGGAARRIPAHEVSTSTVEVVNAALDLSVLAAFYWSSRRVSSSTI